MRKIWQRIYLAAALYVVLVVAVFDWAIPRILGL